MIYFLVMLKPSLNKAEDSITKYFTIIIEVLQVYYEPVRLRR